MNDTSDETITEAIESGEYFKEARHWYHIRFVHTISEAAFFIIITVVAVIIALLAVGGVKGILPLSPVRPFVYVNEDIDAYVPRIERLRVNTDQPIDDAVQRYLLRKYLAAVEEYRQDRFSQNATYVQANSAGDVLEQYRRRMAASNPRSPLVRLGRNGVRKLAIGSPQIMPAGEGLYQTQIPFATQEIYGGRITEQQWLASVEFAYTMLVTKEKELVPDDSEVIGLDIQDANFLVVSYDIREQ